MTRYPRKPTPPHLDASHGAGITNAIARTTALSLSSGRALRTGRSGALVRLLLTDDAMLSNPVVPAAPRGFSFHTREHPPMLKSFKARLLASVMYAALFAVRRRK